MDYKKYNDYELIYMIRENDEEKEKILLDKYCPVIASLAYKYYKRNSNIGYDYEDFYQEALFSFYHALSNYNNEKEVLFYTFVTICMERSLCSFSKKISSKKRNVYNNYINIDEIDYLIEDKDKNIEVINQFTEVEKIYKKTIYSSKMLIGAILELKYNGFTYKEISILLDIPISSIEFKIRRTKQLLRKELSKYYCK